MLKTSNVIKYIIVLKYDKLLYGISYYYEYHSGLLCNKILFNAQNHTKWVLFNIWSKTWRTGGRQPFALIFTLHLRALKKKGKKINLGIKMWTQIAFSAFADRCSICRIKRKSIKDDNTDWRI